MYTLTSPKAILDEFFGDLERVSNQPRTFSPAVDIAQVDDGFLLRADLAGVAKENLRIDVKNQVLSISGERAALGATEGGYRHTEIPTGKFERTFQLADAIDRDKVEAKFENGLLEVKLQIKPELGARQVEIR
jgi:HSP20 family protein